jgi:hypothetical protein
VIATGVVSIAAADHNYWRIAGLLTIAAFALFALLGLGFAARALTQPLRVLRLTRDPDVALRMFTFVAACPVLVERAHGFPTIAWCASGLGLAGWTVLVPLACVDVASRPATQLREHAHGAWLLPSVATQGLACVAADLARTAHIPWLVIIALVTWLLGLLIYLAVDWLWGSKTQTPVVSCDFACVAGWAATRICTCSTNFSAELDPFNFRGPASFRAWMKLLVAVGGRVSALAVPRIVDEQWIAHPDIGAADSTPIGVRVIREGSSASTECARAFGRYTSPRDAGP